MTQVANPRSAADFRVQRARQLRERQLNRAAIAQAAPDATDEERDDLLRALAQTPPDPAPVAADAPDEQPASGPDGDPAGDDPPADRGRRHRLRRAWLGRRPNPPPQPEKPTPAALSTVARPGHRTRPVGRTRSWITKLTLIAAPALLIGGAAFAWGIATGSSRLTGPAVLSTDEAGRYHLSTFPTDRASSFAAAYLTLCLTHPDPADQAAVTNRSAGLSRMASAGVAPSCGWTGTTIDPPPLDVAWNGTATPIPGYPTGAAATLGFTVTTLDGRTLAVTVPVWASSETTAQTMRIVGDVAIMPASAGTPAPTPAPPTLTDATLADTLAPTVLLPFLRAWAASDTVQLGLVLAPQATTVARTGLDGNLRAPQITRTQVVVVSGTPDSYVDDDRITAQVVVDWTTRAASSQRTGYAIGLQRVAGRWQVQSITGGAPDPAGGAAPTSPFATSTVTAPAR